VAAVAQGAVEAQGPAVVQAPGRRAALAALAAPRRRQRQLAGLRQSVLGPAAVPAVPK